MILGTKARYAVMAMVELAGRGAEKPVPLSELAGSQEITIPYLEQIFNKLKRGGIVRSVLGANGGYVLARNASEIHISEIVEAADESMKMTRCDKEKNTGCMASTARCLTHDLWDGLGKSIHSYLSGITLADVLAKK